MRDARGHGEDERARVLLLERPVLLDAVDPVHRPLELTHRDRRGDRRPDQPDDQREVAILPADARRLLDGVRQEVARRSRRRGADRVEEQLSGTRRIRVATAKPTTIDETPARGRARRRMRGRERGSSRRRREAGRPRPSGARCGRSTRASRARRRRSAPTSRGTCEAVLTTHPPPSPAGPSPSAPPA